MRPPSAGTHTVASSSSRVSSTMKRLRGAISSQSFRRKTISTNAMAARDVSTPTTMPRTAIDAIRPAVVTANCMVGASPVERRGHGGPPCQSSSSTAASAGQQMVSRSPIS